MQSSRRNKIVYSLLAAVWALVLAWQAEEHFRVRAAARADLKSRSRDIANTVSACVRGMRFRGAVFQERLESVLEELVSGRTNQLVKASELLSIALLNAAGEAVAAAGRPIDFAQREIFQSGERWGPRSVTFVNPVDLGASLGMEGGSNPVVVLPPMRGFTNSFPERGRENPPPPPPPPETNAPSPELRGETGDHPPPGPPPRGPREGRSGPRRPPWMRGMSDQEFAALLEKREVHGLVLSMSTEAFQAALQRDLWLRLIIAVLATVSVVGSGLAWRNLDTSADLQIRLVRASEMNTHLRGMNLAAAGLAHETRNPLNIIRGLAQLISRQSEASDETRRKAREIMDEADKVASQLNEFINYSRPREVHRAPVSLNSVVSEVVRALGFDLEERRIRLESKGEPLTVEADEQLLRQAVFNLLLNAIQAVEPGGEIQVVASRSNSSEAVLEFRDNGPGVPPENRREIFKPYFTTQKQGTGLGLAIVQQIVLAHGWEIECAGNHPRGAVFRIRHLALAAHRPAGVPA